MFGCASLPGTDPEQLRMPLAYLRHHHLAPRALRARAVPERYVSMDLLPPDEVQVSEARQALPPLIKGYLRLGGFEIGKAHAELQARMRILYAGFSVKKK